MIDDRRRPPVPPVVVGHWSLGGRAMGGRAVGSGLWAATGPPATAVAVTRSHDSARGTTACPAFRSTCCSAQDKGASHLARSLPLAHGHQPCRRDRPDPTTALPSHRPRGAPQTRSAQPAPASAGTRSVGEATGRHCARRDATAKSSGRPTSFRGQSAPESTGRSRCPPRQAGAARDEQRSRALRTRWCQRRQKTPGSRSSSRQHPARGDHTGASVSGTEL